MNIKQTKFYLLFTFFLFNIVFSAPLKNRRNVFYTIASQRGDFTSSPSGMFWDDLGTPDILNTLLWPDTSLNTQNHWLFEPSVDASFSNKKNNVGNKNNYHINVLSDFKFKKFSVRNVLDVDKRYKDDYFYPWKSDRIMAGRFDEAYLQYSGKYGFARFGRVNRNWGPFLDHSILLSDNPFSYDAFEWQMHTPFLEFRHLFTYLGNPPFYELYDSNDRTYDRYLTAHALNFILGEWGSIGASETVVFSKKGGLPPLEYVNPFSLYFTTNTNAEASGNLMFALQFRLNPFIKNILIKGQVVFDDLQIDNKTIGDQEPSHWAMDIGLSVKDFLNIPFKHHIFAEYKYLSRWMYTVSNYNTGIGERYTYIGKSLGYGKLDCDELKISAVVLGNNFWATEIGGGFIRQDTNTISTKWPVVEGSSGALGYRKETPLSERENVETTLSSYINIHGYFKDIFLLTFGFENRWIRNINNVVTNKFEYDPKISFSVTAGYDNTAIKF